MVALCWHREQLKHSSVHKGTSACSQVSSFICRFRVRFWWTVLSSHPPGPHRGWEHRPGFKAQPSLPSAHEWSPRRRFLICKVWWWQWACHEWRNACEKWSPGVSSLPNLSPQANRLSCRHLGELSCLTHVTEACCLTVTPYANFQVHEDLSRPWETSWSKPILLSHKIEENNATCSNMDGPRDYCTEWSKTEKDEYHMAWLICAI